MESIDAGKTLRILGAHFKRIREGRQLSVEKISNDSGFTVQQITQLEEGMWDARLIDIAVLAGTMGMHPKEFFDTDFGSV